MKSPGEDVHCPCLCPSFQDFQDLLSGFFKRGKSDEETDDGTSKNEDSNSEHIENAEIAIYDPSVPQTNDRRALYKALWSFQSRTEAELSFEAGDLFKVVEQSGEWWEVEKLDPQGRTEALGFVPSNYLAREQTVDEQPWFFGILNRLETQKLLLAPANGVGTFLVRRSEKDEVGSVLSVRVSEKEVKHYKVCENENGFYVDHNCTFHELGELVEHYKIHSLSSSVFLTQPCTRPEPKPQDLSHCTMDDWELPKEEFVLEDQLGSGFFADVYRGTWRGKVRVAIKILKNNDSLDHREFQLETQMLKKLRHRHLISLFAICTANVPYYIITEFMEKGNLLSFLQGQEGRSLDPQALTDMASQVADGMAYLEEHNSIHRDLAARNVLVGEEYICKVADFGLARVIKEPFYVSEDKKIPYKWSAPEAISHGRFSSKSDVWSFGILLYEIFTYGGSPYPSYRNYEVYQLITSGYRMPAPDECPSHIYEIMTKCWSGLAAERPDFSELRVLLENASNYWTK
ncbi:protein-tyrosine kinase 6 [Colossoma macropomum]|uniref:protein-tyrosine kinase 6 n=1 Tax=Colossoma macropomum TaxID=42526 RepID=UPI001863DB4D|nr:protein-tyrosine kinase 6 [Colossoma macropomum]